MKIVKIGRFENRGRSEVNPKGKARGLSGLEAIFHAIACAFDQDDFGVMKEAVEDGGGNGAITVKDSWPLLEGFVGGEHDGAALVALADNLEQEIGPALVYGEVAELIKLCGAPHNLINVEFPKM